MFLSFNGNIFICFHCRFCFFLRYEEFQQTVFELRFDILFGDILAYDFILISKAVFTKNTSAVFGHYYYALIPGQALLLLLP